MILPGDIKVKIENPQNYETVETINETVETTKIVYVNEYRGDKIVPTLKEVKTEIVVSRLRI